MLFAFPNSKMSRNSNMKLINVIKNKVLLYLVSRYFTYFIEFLTSLGIAAKLGPFYFGVWGSVLLLLNYFQQLHFGIANSVNVLLVHHIDDRKKCEEYIINSMMLVGIIGGFIILCFALIFFLVPSFFDKYRIDNYFVLVCVIAFLQYFRLLFVNIYRVYNRLGYIIIAQSVTIVLTFFSVIFFKGETLIYSLVLCYLVGNAIAFLLPLFSSLIPKMSLKRLNREMQKSILKKGMFLFLYNSCFYFILISIRTIISYNYKVEEFGVFTFSYTLANAMLLLLEAISFVFFPKIIQKLSSRDDNEVVATVKSLQNTYVISAHLLAYIAILLYPILILFLPKYAGSETSFNFVSLSILVNTSSFVYATILIARNEEKSAAIISLIAFMINLVFGVFLTSVVNVEYYYVIFATMFSYICFTLLVALKSTSLYKSSSKIEILSEAFPLSLVVPFVISLLITLSRLYLLHFVPLSLFVVLNRDKLLFIKETVLKLVVNPSLANLGEK